MSERTKRRHLNVDVENFFSENSVDAVCTLNPLLTNAQESNRNHPSPTTIPFDCSNNVFLETYEANEIELILHSVSELSVDNKYEQEFGDENVVRMSVEDSDLSDEEDIELEKSDIRDEIAEWATKFQISFIALSALLHILRMHNLDLSKDPRTY